MKLAMGLTFPLLAWANRLGEFSDTIFPWAESGMFFGTTVLAFAYNWKVKPTKFPFVFLLILLATDILVVNLALQVYPENAYSKFGIYPASFFAVIFEIVILANAGGIKGWLLAMTPICWIILVANYVNLGRGGLVYPPLGLLIPLSYLAFIFSRRKKAPQTPPSSAPPPA